MTIAHNTTKKRKQCNVCLEYFPESLVFFYYKDKSANKIYRDNCKNCTTPSRGKKRSEKTDVLNRYEVNENGCWIYTGKLDQAGYGVFYHQQFGFKAHRISYEVIKGEIATGLVLDHLCKTKACINPDHLEAVSQGENQNRWWQGIHCPGCQCEGK